MRASRLIAQLRTTDLDGSIAFCTRRLGLAPDSRRDDVHAGLSADGHALHLRRVDAPDPSIAMVAEGEHFHLCLMAEDADAAAAELARRGAVLDAPPADAPWGTREFRLRDDRGHTLYDGRMLSTTAGQDQA